MNETIRVMRRRTNIAIAVIVTVNLLAGGAVLFGKERLTIRVRPFVLLSGGSVSITCRVPREAENRWLEYGIEGYRRSGASLDGERARITSEPWIIEHMPCGVGPAYCAVTKSNGHVVRVSQDVIVTGCEVE